MSRDRLIAIAVIAAGLASGPWALGSARAAQPPIGWSDLPFVLIMSVIGVVFVVGLQVGMRRIKGTKLSWHMMSAGGMYFIAAGLSAVVAAYVGANVDAAAMLFLALGVGASAGAALCKVIFRASFAT